MRFFELESSDISNLNDNDLRELVARLCEADLSRQGISPVHVKWGGAQEAPDGGLDVYVQGVASLPSPGFVPCTNTGIQVKKSSMSKAACKKEMQDQGNVKKVISTLADNNGAYIIVSGEDSCSEKMFSDRILGMKLAIANLPNRQNIQLEFYCRDRLSNWLRQYPGVSLWARIKLGKPLSGWKPFGRWTSIPSEQNDALLLDEHPCVRNLNSSDKNAMPLVDGIKLVRDKLRIPKSAVRITGLSGVGKTRFAQSLFETEVEEKVLSPTNVIYADLGESLTPTASELMTYLISNNYAAFLVLDNCPPDVHRQLQKQLSQSSARLCLLTIEYDVSDDKPEETDVIHLEPSSEKTISALIQRRFPELGQLNAEKVAEFSGGNARVAIALANRVDADETLSKFSEDDLFKRLFDQRKENAPSLLPNAEILSLVYSFNTAPDEFNNELSVLGRIGGVGRASLYKDNAELFRRQLIQKRGNWRAVLPHALSNRLAHRALENIAVEDINAELLKRENIRLLKSCAHRLGYLHDCHPAHELAKSWLKPNAPLHQIAECDEDQLTILDYIAPVFPTTALSAIEIACEEPNFASRKNMHFSKVVRLLTKLAYDDAMFDKAASLILKFAETEKKDENYDSVVSRLSQLFSLYLSGTKATPKRRQGFLQRLHISDNTKHQQIADKLFSSAFETYHWSAFGSFSFGARKRDWGWQPKTDSDKKEWYAGFIDILMPGFESNNKAIRDRSRSILVTHFRGLWSRAHCFDTLESIIKQQTAEEHWPEMWQAVKLTLNYDGDNHTPELLMVLKELEKTLAPSSFVEMIESHIFVNIYALTENCNGDNAEKYQEISKRITEFGEKAATEDHLIEYLAPRLWNAKTDSIWFFGKGLAQGSKDKTKAFEHLVALMQMQKLDLVCPDIFAGFIKAVYVENPEQARQLQGRTLYIPELQSYFVQLLSSTPIDQWGAHKLLEVAQAGILEAWRFEHIRLGRIHETIIDKDLAAILTAVNGLNNGVFSVIEILSMRFFIENNSDYLPSEPIRKVGRVAICNLLSLDKNDGRERQLFCLDRVAEICLPETAPKNEIDRIIELLCQGLTSDRLFKPDITKIISVLVKNFPELVLDRVFASAESRNNLSYYLFKDSFSRHTSYLNDVPISRILEWCKNDESRIQAVANSISAYRPYLQEPAAYENPTKVILTEHAFGLLDAADNKLAIAEWIYEDISPPSYQGSRADMVEVRSKAFAALTEHNVLEIREFAASKMVVLEQTIRRSREQEAAEYNQLEQRFE
jgi:hypothetical protein